LNRIVVDASYCGAWVLQDENSTEAEELLKEALLDGGPVLLAPALWTFEMLNMLKSAVKRKRLTENDARAAVRLLSRIPIQLVSPKPADTRLRMLELALRHDLTAYDASYLELALRLKIPLRSGDKKLRAAFEHQT